MRLREGFVWRLIRSLKPHWVPASKWSTNSHSYLGHDELLDVESAIKLAIDYRQKINDGIDPKLDLERQQQLKLITFDDCAQRYLEKKRSKIKTTHIYERIYNNEIKAHLGNLRIDRVHSYDIDSVLQKAVSLADPPLQIKSYYLSNGSFDLRLNTVQSHPTLPLSFRPQKMPEVPIVSVSVI